MKCKNTISLQVKRFAPAFAIDSTHYVSSNVITDVDYLSQIDLCIWLFVWQMPKFVDRLQLEQLNDSEINVKDGRRERSYKVISSSVHLHRDAILFVYVHIVYRDIAGTWSLLIFLRLVWLTIVPQQTNTNSNFYIVTVTDKRKCAPKIGIAYSFHGVNCTNKQNSPKIKDHKIHGACNL